MNNALKYIVGGLICLATLACVFVALVRAEKQKEGLVFTGIEIQNDSPQGRRFLEDEELIALVNQQNGIIVGRKVDGFDFVVLENNLNRTSCILKSQAYCDREGVLHIQVKERKPFARLQTTSGGFYVDRQGKVFPLQSHYCAWVPVVDGKMPVGNWYTFGEPEQAWMHQLIGLVAAFQDTPKWKNLCTQIHFDKRGQAILVLDGYPERFILGDLSDIDKKQRKIEKYISQIRPQLAEKKYTTVNVRFDGQIICQ